MTLRLLGIACLVAAQALLLCGLPATAPVPAPAVSRRPVTGTRRQSYQRLLAEVQKLRGLRFRHPVPSYLQSREAMRRYLRKTLDEDTDWTRESAVLKSFGFVPERFRLRAFMLAFYTEQVAGYYDYHTRSFYMIDDALKGAGRGLAGSIGKQTSALDDSMVLHEMDHALQDQHFGLAALDGLTHHRKQDDFSEAVQSLIEGDATVVMFASLFQQMGVTLKDGPPLGAMLRETGAMTGMTGGGEQFDRAPLYFRRMALFPYLNGAAFVDYFQRRGGWPAVNRLYRHLPASTAQIIHPALYAAGIVPRNPRLAPLPALPGGWRQMAQNTLGEERVDLLFEQHLPAQGSGRARYRRSDGPRLAAGWSGDRFRIYARGGKRFLIWCTLWDSAADALHFADGMRQVEGRRFRRPLHPYPERRRHAFRWRSVRAGEAWDVERGGNRVAVVEQVPLALEARLLDLAWEAAADRHSPSHAAAPSRQGYGRGSVN